MRARTATGLAALVVVGALAGAGCTGAPAGSQATDAGSGTYTTRQTQIFHDYLPYAYAVLINTTVPYGGVIEPDQFATRAQWSALELQGQHLCDVARTSGWPAARASLKATLGDAVRAGIDPGVYVTTMAASVTTQASYCPELAAGALGSDSAAG